MSKKHKAAKHLSSKKARYDHGSKVTEIDVIRGDLKIHAWQSIALGLAILVITILTTILLTK